MYYASIAPPKDEEIEFIKNLTDKYNVSRNSRTIGFVEFPNYSIKDFRNRIFNSSNSFVMNYGIPIGFITSYSNLAIDQLDGFDLIKNQLSDESNYLYVEQLAIHEDYRNKGLAFRLMDFTLDVAKLDEYSSVFAATSHAPFNHRIVRRMLSKYNFNLRNEFDLEGMTFGLYELRFSK